MADARPRRRSPSNRQSSELSVAASGWAAAHARCLIESLGRLSRRWVASLLTVFVIGISLALPTGLYIIAKNMDSLSTSWHQSVQISVYLDTDLSAKDGAAMAQHVAALPTVSHVHFISAEQGLAEFKKSSGFGSALAALGANPLPGVIQVTPKAALGPAAVGSLVQRLSAIDGVTKAALNQAWLRRLTAILSLIDRISWVIGILLSAAVLFIVGNTIRLDIENRRQEIEVMKLLGATDAFIRRPFLYSGFWHGLFGALIALVILGSCDLALGNALSTLVSSYNGKLVVRGIGIGSFALVVLIGVLLGWLGCAITVNRQLAAIEPA